MFGDNKKKIKYKIMYVADKNDADDLAIPGEILECSSPLEIDSFVKTKIVGENYQLLGRKHLNDWGWLVYLLKPQPKQQKQQKKR